VYIYYNVAVGPRWAKDGEGVGSGILTEADLVRGPPPKMGIFGNRLD
jgi:hypothetical protein